MTIRRPRNIPVKRLISALSVLLLLASIFPRLVMGAPCPCSLWSPSATPAQTNVTDSQRVELGVKFRADSAGTVSGIRFHKGTLNTGTHTGSLWSASGTRLATATFVNETASGWQQVNFTTPVTVSANTTYVASYLAPNGRYSATNNGLASAVVNAPLRTLAGTSNNGNGVYRYGGGFPNSSYQNTNYWVDVIFNTSSAPDTIAPTVTTTIPTNNATNITVNSDVRGMFNEGLSASTVNSTTFELRAPGNTLVPAAISYDSGANTAVLNPSADLSANTTYTATLRGGTTDPRIKDAANNALASSYAWSFTTAVATPPPSNSLDQGPGGPVLVVKSDANPFSKYYAEILRAEGLNSFASADVSALTSTLLNQYDVVVLGEVALTTDQVTQLTTWVNNGGNLIAMRPDKKLTSLLGLTDQTSTLDNAYLQVNTAAAPGAGIVGQTMQFHGTADRYTANSGTDTVASLYTNATTANNTAAVTMRNVGANGGQAAAFTYDLARSVVYTRQGNPAWAGQERDNNSVIRPNDLFFGAAPGDVQPDWVNLDKVAIPQADEQQRLLTNLIAHVNQDKKPLPKLWYFPKNSKAVMVMAGDDHGTPNGTQTTFNSLVNASPAGCNVANWECHRATSWLYSYGPMTNAQAASYNAQGFDIGSHISTNCENWTPTSLLDAFNNDLATFQAKYTSLPDQTGNRTHCIPWSDWATQPKVELTHNIRMDMNYYYWPGSWVQNRPGFMNGSGLPMRFGDSDGSMIDVYQQASHLVNESGMTFPAAINTMLDRALGTEGYYGAFGTHYDHSDNFDQQLINSAIARGVPLVSAQQMLDWTDGRNNSSLTQIAWNGNTLNFTASVDSRTGTMLRGMLPMQSSQGILGSISRSGSPVTYTTETIKGVSYAIFPVANGQFTASYATDTTAPQIVNRTPALNATGVGTATNVTAAFSEPLDPATVNTTTVELRTSTNQLVPASVSYGGTNTATLQPIQALSANATYTATIRGGTTGVKDVSGNALAANTTWSFTTAAGPACPCSLWQTTALPATITANDPLAVELGVKFTSDIPGTITGIRFYKGPQNTGAHTISLWNSTNGLQMATAPVTGETASGWQTASFASPVPIAANTTYIASYLAPNGRYSATNNFFASAVNTVPLHAPATGTSGGNGVYRYGGGFPDASYQASNYWVDVIFTP